METSKMGTPTEDRLPLEIKGLELLSEDGLEELRQYVEKEIARRRDAATPSAISNR